MSRPHLASALPLHLADRHFARALTARLARCRRWVELKMRELGCLDHPAFKLIALFDATAMITCEARGYGVLDVKPLGVVWGLYPQFSAANTLMLDDLSRNFLMNPQSGLKIRPCALLALPPSNHSDPPSGPALARPACGSV